jgi:outer membrane protein assembly factor BamB
MLIIVAVDTSELVALDLTTGNLLWSYTSDKLLGTVYNGVTVGSDGVIYVVTDTGWLHALDPGSGTFYWSVDLAVGDNFYYPPAISGGNLYFAGANQALYIFDVANFVARRLGETVGVPTQVLMTVEGLWLLVAATDQGWVHAYALDTGEWRGALLVSSTVAGLATDGARIYIAATDGNIYGWDGYSTEPTWVVNVGVSLSSAPLTDGSALLVGTHNGELLYLDPASGVEVQERRIALGDPVLYTPAPAGGWLFVRGSTVYGVGP